MKPLLTIFILAFTLGSYAQEIFTDSFTAVPNSPGSGDELHHDASGIAHGTEVVEVTNPKTGRIWMDRNLGASRAATSPADEAAYGDLYQWGRGADGHQKRRSGTTGNLSKSSQPGHAKFIISPNSYDWRSPKKNNLWRGVNAPNNPCPQGFRLPTRAEWEAERKSWDSNNIAGAYASPLKLAAGGARYHFDGSLDVIGITGFYWSSSASGSKAHGLIITKGPTFMDRYAKAVGMSVRCIKD